MSTRTEDESPLVEGFYRKQRDDLQAENHQLRERILNLEATIRAANQLARRIIAETAP